MTSKKISQITEDPTPDLGDVTYATDTGGTTDKQVTVSAILNAGAGKYIERENRKLWNHRRALRNAADGTGRLVIGYLGDSTTEGVGGLTSIEERALNICQEILRDRYSTADTGRGYIAAWTYPTFSESVTLTGDYTLRSTEGLGFRSVSLNDSGAMATWELHGTDMIMCYASYGGASHPKSEYRVNGGAWTEIEHTPGDGFDFREEQLAVSLGAEDDYTVEWRWKADGTGIATNPVIEGIIEINGDPDLGISVLDMGHSGYDVDEFENNTGNTLISSWISDFDVTTVVLGLGINDWIGAVDPALYKSDLTALIARLRVGNPDLEVVLRGGWTPYGTGDPDDFHLYMKVQYEIAAADPLTSVFDARRMIPEPGYMGGGDEHYHDAFLAEHPNADGYRAIGTADADHLSLRTGGAYADDDRWVTRAMVDAKQPLDSDLSAIAAVSTTQTGRALLTSTAITRSNPPSGAIAETLTRDIITSGLSALTSGTLRLVSIELPAGVLVTSLTFVSGTQAAVTPTNWWFCLLNSSRVTLRKTADQTSTAWAANTAKTVSLASTYTTTYSGTYYLGVVMAAATPINLQVYTANATLNALPPIRAGNTTDTGLTTPVDFNPAGSITSSQNIVYAYAS